MINIQYLLNVFLNEYQGVFEESKFLPKHIGQVLNFRDV
jgi:hypothetical protein